MPRAQPSSMAGTALSPNHGPVSGPTMHSIIETARLLPSAPNEQVMQPILISLAEAASKGKRLRCLNHREVDMPFSAIGQTPCVVHAVGQSGMPQLTTLTGRKPTILLPSQTNTGPTL